MYFSVVIRNVEREGKGLVVLPLVFSGGGSTNEAVPMYWRLCCGHPVGLARDQGNVVEWLHSN
jgi:hypothetical protein